MPTVHAFASAPARSACMRRACTAGDHRANLPPAHRPLCAACCSGNLVLTCGKDNLLRCVDVRRFEVGPMTCSGAILVLCCAVLCRAATSVHLLPTRVDTHHWPRICCRHLAPLPASLACLPACLQVRHTLSAPSFNVGGAWTAACLRCGSACGGSSAAVPAIAATPPLLAASVCFNGTQPGSPNHLRCRCSMLPAVPFCCLQP